MGQGRAGSHGPRWQRHEVDDERSVRRPDAAGPSRSSRLDRILTELVGQVPEIEAASVVSFDGLAMASALPAGMDEDRVAAMSAALLSLGERAAEGLGRGTLSQVYIEGENGTVFLISADDEAVLVAVAAKGAKVGLMLFEVRRAAAAVAEALRVELALRRAGRGGTGAGTRCRSSRRRPTVRAMSPSVPNEHAELELTMKLEGSLDAFSLPDIFQLLSFTKKTGGLHLAHDGSDGVVFFAGGQVTGASADSSRQPLARRLVGSGTLTDEALAGAVEAAPSGEGVGVVRALLDQGAVDADLLRAAAQRPVGRRGLRPAALAGRRLRLRHGRGQPRRRRRVAVASRPCSPTPRRAGPAGSSVSQVVPSPQAVLVDAGRAARRPAGQPRGVVAAGPGRRPAHGRRAGRPDRQRPVRRRLDPGRPGAARAARGPRRGGAEARSRRPRHRRAAPPAAARPARG